MCSAISSMSSYSVFSAHLSGFQISILFPAPTHTISFSSEAYALNSAGIKTLPCLSVSRVAAPARKNLTNLRTFLSVNDSDPIFSANIFHSLSVNPNIHWSNPLVITNFSPSSSLNLAGTIALPFVSTF